MTTPKEAYAAIVAALPEAARTVYGERLLALVLFGSVARGTQRPDSDIDLLIVAAPLPEGRFARVAEFEAMEALLAAACSSISSRRHCEGRRVMACQGHKRRLP